MNKIIYQKGFTLIELLVVISIISLLSTVVMSSLNSSRDRGRIAAGQQFEASVSHIAGDSLVGRWDFSDCISFNDYSGNGNNSTPVNSPALVSDIPGGNGCSAKFDGTNYLSAPDSSSLNLSGSFTISFWLKPNSWDPGAYGSPSSGIISKKSSDGSNGYVIYNDTMPASYCADGLACHPRINLRIKGTLNNYPYLSSKSIVKKSVWQNWTITYDNINKTLSWYLDGKLDKTYSNIDVGDMTNSSPLTIGLSQTWNGKLTGNLDNVRIYSKSLIASKIQENYFAEKDKYLSFALNN